jgi:tight adherence protein B
MAERMRAVTREQSARSPALARTGRGVGLHGGDHRSGRILLVAACTLALFLLLAACSAPLNTEAIRMEATLARAHLSAEEQDIYRVQVRVQDTAGKPVNHLQIHAEVLDADEHPIASLPCEPVPYASGSYHSAPFTPAAEAAGLWHVKLTASKGPAAVEQAWAFQVDEFQATAEQPPEHSVAQGEDLPDEALFEQVSYSAPAADIETRSASAAALAEWQAQQTNRALFFAVLVALAAVIGFVGIWRTTHSLDPIRARLQEYGLDGRSAFSVGEIPATGLRQMPRLKRLMSGLGLGPQLADQLAQADIPLTATEFLLIILAAALLGGLVSIWRFGFPLGLLLATPLGYLPMLYLNIAKARRRRAFTDQLPDALTLLVGALRAGYGLTQALQVLVNQLPAPASKEFSRMVNVVSLGMPMQQALNDLAERIQTDDVGLTVTAITVQYQIGGNLAETLDTIAETIRSRIRIQRQIQALTAEERLTGYILAALPTVLGFVLFTMNPDYMSGLFAPGLPRLMCVAALILQFIGYLIIRRIIAIEV